MRERREVCINNCVDRVVDGIEATVLRTDMILSGAATFQQRLCKNKSLWEEAGKTAQSPVESVPTIYRTITVDILVFVPIYAGR